MRAIIRNSLLTAVHILRVVLGDFVACFCGVPLTKVSEICVSCCVRAELHFKLQRPVRSPLVCGKMRSICQIPLKLTQVATVKRPRGSPTVGCLCKLANGVLWKMLFGVGLGREGLGNHCFPLRLTLRSPL